jgi:hypothetical protein
MIWQLVLGMILTSIGAVFVLYSSREETKAFFKCMATWIFTMAGILLLWDYADSQPLTTPKPLTFEIKVEVNTINGVEISRDTTYIYTKPK